MKSGEWRWDRPRPQSDFAAHLESPNPPDACIYRYMYIYIYIYIYTSLSITSSDVAARGIPTFPRRDSEPRKRLRESRAMPCVLLSSMCVIALFSRSLFSGLESLLGNLEMDIACCLSCFAFELRITFRSASELRLGVSALGRGAKPLAELGLKQSSARRGLSTRTSQSRGRSYIYIERERDREIER